MVGASEVAGFHQSPCCSNTSDCTEWIIQLPHYLIELLRNVIGTCNSFNHIRCSDEIAQCNDCNELVWLAIAVGLN